MIRRLRVRVPRSAIFCFCSSLYAQVCLVPCIVPATDKWQLFPAALLEIWPVGGIAFEYVRPITSISAQGWRNNQNKQNVNKHRRYLIFRVPRWFMHRCLFGWIERTVTVKWKVIEPNVYQIGVLYWEYGLAYRDAQCAYLRSWSQASGIHILHSFFISFPT